MMLKQAILEAADTFTPKKTNPAPALHTYDPEAKRPRVAPALPAGMAMAATEQEYTPGPDEIYAYAFQAAMAVIRQNVDKHCYNCGVMGHISRNCPGNNPQFTSQRERVSRWDRAGVGRQSSAPPAYGRGANPMGPGGRGFSSPMGGRG
eukprot:1748830-Rhodomonas_salina.1